MKIDILSYNDFKKNFDPKITVCRLYPQMPDLKIETLVTIQKIKFETLGDFERLENLKLVWYKDAFGKTTGWDDVEARHLELKNENDEEAYPPYDKDKITKFISILRAKKLTNDIEIISATDLKLNKEIIVDGVHRAIAIYRCFRREPEVLEKIFSSQPFGIYLINFHSPAASIFFPCDFLNFYKIQSP